MNKHPLFLPRDQLLTLEEIVRLANCLCTLGIIKLRLTGGEPLLRRNLLWLCEQLASIESLQELTLTTNGKHLVNYAQGLYAAGINRINISLDSLQPERFHALTRFGSLTQVLAGIEAARAAGFQHIKLNCVILKNYNHDEVNQLAAFAIAQAFDICFIEAMPIGDHETWLVDHLYTSDAIRQDLASQFELQPIEDHTGGPARYWRIIGTKTRVGFISAHSDNFCATCNRIRITASGQLITCLGRSDALDLRTVLRDHPHDDAPLMAMIRTAIAAKPASHHFYAPIATIPIHTMYATGG
jgi:cyclic pyranopterin phosphate synthase